MSHVAQGHSPEHPLRFRVDLARCLTQAAFVRTLRDEFDRADRRLDAGPGLVRCAFHRH